MPIEPVEPLASHTSGSAGLVTASHNQFGRYTRARTVPLDPGTSAQIAVRNAFSTIANRWVHVLTRSQRDAWDAYAAAVSLTDPLGHRRNVGGLPMYVRSNVPRIQANEPLLPIVDTAPTSHDLGPLTAPIRTVLNIVDDTFHPFINPFDAWNAENGAAMLFYTSRPQPLSTNFFKAPYRLAAVKLGSVFGPFFTPLTLPLAFPAGASQRVFVRGRVTRADARLSRSFRVPADIVPQVAPLITSALIAGGPVVFTTRCFFDQLLRSQSHSTANWQIRFNGFQHQILAANNFTGGIALFHRPTFIVQTGDFVSYTAASPDVFGLLTGIPVAAFTDFPIT